MPANVGEMFYYGDVPWHREGSKLDHPANMEKPLSMVDWIGGLEWFLLQQTKIHHRE